MNLLNKIRVNKRGFTLIELLVVMAVVAVLVLLASPRFIGQTREAELTKHVNNIKVLEDASERYFVDHGKWPRGEEEPYSAEELDEYTDRIYDETGAELQLDEGNYWDIDYEALAAYVRLPDEDDLENYVLRNPVGKIYYAEGIDEEKKEQFDILKGNTKGSEGRIVGITEYINDHQSSRFYGLHANAFDGDDNTYHTGVGTVTWDGNIADREISITGSGFTAYRGAGTLQFSFHDAEGNVLQPANSNRMTTSVSNSSTAQTVKVVVPEGAVKIVFEGTRYSNSMKIHDISLPEEANRPSNIELFASTTPSSVTVEWKNAVRAIISKDGIILGDVKGKSFTDAPLYSGQEQLYDVLLMDENGNGQKVKYKVVTPVHIVSFRGLTPVAFDGNSDTHYDGVGTVTWNGNLANREISITGSGFTAYRGAGTLQFSFYDAEGNVLQPANSNRTTTTVSSSSTVQTVKVVVPEGAVNIVFNGTRFPERMKIHDIQVLD